MIPATHRPAGDASHSSIGSAKKRRPTNARTSAMPNHRRNGRVNNTPHHRKLHIDTVSTLRGLAVPCVHCKMFTKEPTLSFPLSHTLSVCLPSYRAGDDHKTSECTALQMEMQNRSDHLVGFYHPSDASAGIYPPSIGSYARGKRMQCRCCVCLCVQMYRFTRGNSSSTCSTLATMENVNRNETCATTTMTTTVTKTPDVEFQWQQLTHKH